MAPYQIFPSIIPDGTEVSAEDATRSEDVGDDEGCPFCDGYEGENWRHHAVQIHPERYSEYKDKE